MSVDISDVGGLYTGVVYSLTDASQSAPALGVRSGNVISVAGVAAAGYFGVDFSAASLGVFLGFKHERAAALANNKTVACDVKGTACRYGFVVAA